MTRLLLCLMLGFFAAGIASAHTMNSDIALAALVLTSGAAWAAFDYWGLN